MKVNNIFTKSKLAYALGFVAILSTSVAQADSFDTEFEKNQGYKVGPLNEQNGWQATTNVNVENLVFEEGKQAVKIGVTAGTYDYQYANAPLPYAISITNKHTSVAFYFLTNNTSNNTQAGVNIIGTNGSLPTGSLGQLFAKGTGNSGSPYSYFFLEYSNLITDPVPLVNGVWHRCILDFDFENNIITGQVDGTVNLGMLPIKPATVITAIQLYNITGGITSTSDAFFDLININYNTGGVIPPAVIPPVEVIPVEMFSKYETCRIKYL